jgi:hypothetical protein
MANQSHKGKGYGPKGLLFGQGAPKEILITAIGGGGKMDIRMGQKKFLWSYTALAPLSLSHV